MVDNSKISKELTDQVDQYLKNINAKEMAIVLQALKQEQKRRKRKKKKS